MSPSDYAKDPIADLVQHENKALDAIFSPRSVAVIGASEKPGSVGRTVLWNLIINPFGGVVYPVNPNRPSVMGIKAYPTVADVPDQIDLAVVVTPAKAIPALISECADVGVKGAIVISAGFKELGAPGIALEEEILRHAQRGRMRIVGPNCLGVMNPITGLNATFAGTMARPGNVAFISQSGALCTAILDWSIREQVGFSSFVSIGSMLDVDWGDLIAYLGHDESTQSIVMYMESIGSASSFLSAAREVALSKPIIVIKAGRTAAAAKAAASHTGSLTGSDDVLDAAFRRAGVLRVESIEELFDMAEVLGKQPRPKGPRLSILTNAGGPGVLATDALITSGGQLAEIDPATFSALNNLLPPHWSRNNPIDILGDAGPERYAKALEAVGKDPNTDGLLVILTPQDMTDATQTAEHLKPYASHPDKPLLASWMGGPDVEEGVDILNKAGIPTYAYPDLAARAFTYMCQYSENLKSLYQTPLAEALEASDKHPDRSLAAEIINRAVSEDRAILTEAESKQLLSAYGIPTVETRVAKTMEEAADFADAIGYPVVLKLYSQTITHKTDVGGVQLDLGGRTAVKQAYEFIQKSVAKSVGKEHFDGVTVQPMLELKDGYELIVGASLDPQFGPVMLFGLGGQLVEVFKDSALGLPPLNATLARQMMSQTKIFHALHGVRGRKPINLDELEKILLRFSQLICEQRRIKESDINPLFASPEHLLALDARFVLHPKEVTDDELPRPAIRPYPIQYCSECTITGNVKVTIRPIRPEDEPALVKFHETLSYRTVYMRFGHDFHFAERTTHERLARVCFVDYDRQMYLVACVRDPVSSAEQIVAVGRLSRIRGTKEAIAAMIVADAYQNRGLGSKLAETLRGIAQNEKLERIYARVLQENQYMLQLCKSVGFELKPEEGGRFILGELKVQ